MSPLTHLDHLIEEEGMVYLARTDNTDPDNVLAPLQSASSTWRIAEGPRAGRKVLTLVGNEGDPRALRQTRDLCANAQGFSLHAGVHCAANDRQGPSAGSGQALNNYAATSRALRFQTNGSPSTAKATWCSN